MFIITALAKLAIGVVKRQVETIRRIAIYIHKVSIELKKVNTELKKLHDLFVKKEVAEMEIQGVKDIQDRLNRIAPDYLFSKAVEAAWPEIQRILAEYPPPKYVTRTEAYGKPFSSDKQRRWFFSALARGEIQVPYHRSGELAHSWTLAGHATSDIGASFSAGPAVQVSNNAPGARFVYGPTQSRHEQLVGWPKLEELEQRVGEVVAREYEKQVKKEWERQAVSSITGSTTIKLF